MNKLDSGEREIPENSADKDVIVPSAKTEKKKETRFRWTYFPFFYFWPGGKSYCGMGNFSQIALFKEKTTD